MDLARGSLAVVLIALLGFLPAGCASTHNVARDLTIRNQPDYFEMRIGSLESFSQRLGYQWTNSRTKATVRQGSSIQDGEATIEIRDPTGLVVHSKSLRELGTFNTAEGKPGVWKITVRLSKATGSVTFMVHQSA